MPSADEIRKERFGDHGQFLREADSLEIYSIESTGSSILPSELPTKTEFHGFKIYGKALTVHRPEIEAAWSEIYDRIYAKPGDSYTYCFWPRHGIRAFHGVEFRDFLICFECNHLHVYTDPTSNDYERIGLETLDGTLTLDTLLDGNDVPRERTDPSNGG